jgi:hypothetical protein
MAIHDGLPAVLHWVPVVKVEVLVRFIANLVLWQAEPIDLTTVSSRSEALTAGDVPVPEPRASLRMDGLDEGIVHVEQED